VIDFRFHTENRKTGRKQNRAAMFSQFNGLKVLKIRLVPCFFFIRLVLKVAQQIEEQTTFGNLFYALLIVSMIA